MSVALRFLAAKTLITTSCVACFGGCPLWILWRAQDVGLSGALDPRVLEWAAQEGHVLLRMMSDMTAHAYARVSSDLPMPG